MSDALTVGMKRTLTLLTSVAMLIAGTASAEPSGDPFEGKLRPIPKGQVLTREEVVASALPYINRVARCYQRNPFRPRGRLGELGLYLVIARDGRVVHSEVDAPGLPKLRETPLERCLRNEVRTWRFPRRTGFTNVTIPYYFLHTAHPTNELRPDA